MYFAAVLLALALTCVAADVVHDVSDCQDSYLLCDRLSQLERLLMGQSRLLRQLQSRLSDQEELNGDLVEKLSQQHGLLRQLLFTVYRQEDQLLRQDKELSYDKQLINQQANKLSGQEALLLQLQSTVFNQEGQLQRQGEKLFKQESLLNHQAARLTQQDRLFRQQEVKLSRQASLVQQLRDKKACDIAELKTLKARLNYVAENPGCNSERKDLQMTPLLSESSVITPRSDDQGPLEAVVSHMGQQLTEMSADIQALKNSDHQQDQAIEDAQSSTFIHWGNSKCSNASQLIYSGVVGGSYYGHTGAATNYLCLTMSPVPSDHSLTNRRAYLYGGEYSQDSHQDKDAVCAVCRSRQSSTIMIPGTNVCTPGSHQHYNGFLMSNHYDFPAGSEFVCVDSKMESRDSSTDSHNSKLFYFTVTQSGSLPCDPYINNKVVTCVV